MRPPARGAGAPGPPRPLRPPQVVSSILRNLSWRADIHSKKVLREVGSMTALMRCVLRASKVGTGAGRGRVRGVEAGAGGGRGRARAWGGPGRTERC